MVMTAAVFFELPIARWGLTVTISKTALFNPKIKLNLNLKMQKYETEIDLPKVNEVMNVESEMEYVFHLTSLTVPKLIVEPLTPVEVMPHLTFINAVVNPNDMKEMVHLQIAPYKFLSVSSDNRVVLSEVPVKWTVIRHGRTGAIITLYMPTVGYLSVDPITKAVILSPTTPTYWLVEHVSTEKFKLKTIITTMRRELPLNYVNKWSELLEFVNIFRKEQVVVKEMEHVYKMFDVSTLIGETFARETFANFANFGLFRESLSLECFQNGNSRKFIQ